MKDQQIDRLADAIVMGLQRKIDQEVRSMPAPPKESRLFRLFMAAAVVAVVVAVSLAGLNFFAPVLVGAPAQAATAQPTLPTNQPVGQPAAPPQEIPTAVPATPAPVIVVTPTFSTGCHEGVSYVDGVAVNGGCAGGAFAPEQPTETAAPPPTFMPATAVPPDPVYMDALREQSPHCIRGCVPTPVEGE